MDFTLSEEQVMLRDTVRRFLRDQEGGVGAGRRAIDQQAWQHLAELGVISFLLPTSAGGLGGRPQDAAIVAEEFGRALAITPLSEGILGATNLIARFGSPEQIDRLVTPVITGDSCMALAMGQVDQVGNGRISGSCQFARWAPSAHALVVLTREAAFVVTKDSAGLTFETSTLIDGTPAATVTFQSVAAECIELPTGTTELVQAEAQLGYAAEMLGAMELLYGQTVDYARQREQFGKPIGSFQVIQHKLARMFVLLEQSRSILLKAGLRDIDDPAFVSGVVTAKAYLADAAQRLAEEAVQIHGGIGITEEAVVGRGLRRITVLTRLFGTAEEARLQLAL